jgi:NADH-quinone oxidoreductase subunit A
MLQPYVPLLLLIAFVVANAVLILGLSHVLSSYRRTPTKIAPYESGVPVLGDARERSRSSFTWWRCCSSSSTSKPCFMIPWAVAFRQLSEIVGC